MHAAAGGSGAGSPDSTERREKRKERKSHKSHKSHKHKSHKSHKDKGSKRDKDRLEVGADSDPESGEIVAASPEREKGVEGAEHNGSHVEDQALNKSLSNRVGVEDNGDAAGSRR